MAQKKIERELSLREKLGYEASKDGVDCSKDPVLVEEHHANELDINKIIQKYSPRDVFKAVNVVDDIIEDFTSFEDFQDVMNRVARSKEAFMELPAEIRRQFDNDPAKLVFFVQDKANYEEAVRLGLVEKKDVEKKDVEKKDTV